MQSFKHSFKSGFINGYKITTLENNWNEDRFDLDYLKESKPIPSDYEQNYETTYKELVKHAEESEESRRENIFAKKHRLAAYPGHQPEIDPKQNQRHLNTYETDSRVNYLDPRLKKLPIDLDSMFNKNQIGELKK